MMKGFPFIGHKGHYVLMILIMFIYNIKLSNIHLLLTKNIYNSCLVSTPPVTTISKHVLDTVALTLVHSLELSISADTWGTHSTQRPES